MTYPKCEDCFNFKPATAHGTDYFNEKFAKCAVSPSAITEDGLNFATCSRTALSDGQCGKEGRLFEPLLEITRRAA